MKTYSAFSGIEMGIVIFLSIFITSLLVFLFNPSKNISEKRNDIRLDNITKISNAISQYSDEKGKLPETIPISEKCKGEKYEICKTGSANCEGKVDLNILTVDNAYFVTIPVDPKNTSLSGTGYNVVQNGSGRVTICAPKAELGVNISLTN